MSASRDGFAPTTHAEIEADRRRRMEAMLATDAGNASAQGTGVGVAGAAPARNGTPALSGLPLGLGGGAPGSGLEPPVYRKDGSLSPRPQVANRRKRRYAGEPRLTLTDAEVQLVAAAWIARAHRTRTRSAGWNAIAHHVVRRATAQGRKWSAEGAQRSIALGKAARAASLWQHADSGARASERVTRSVRERSARRLAIRVTASDKRWTRKDGKRVAIAILERLAKTVAA